MSSSTASSSNDDLLTNCAGSLLCFAVGVVWIIAGPSLTGFAAESDLFVVEAPFTYSTASYPEAESFLLARADTPTHAAISPGYHATPRTSWSVFEEFELTSRALAEKHHHNHSADEHCESCEAFQQSRREMMARVFDELIARLAAQTPPDSLNVEVDDVESIRVEPVPNAIDNQPNETRRSMGGNTMAILEETEILIRPLDQVGVGIQPTLERNPQLPPNLAGRKYVSFAMARPTAGGEAKPWSPKTYYWHAPSFYHRPLYFEQVNLERYGHYHKNWQIQSVLSAAHFFGTIAALPLHCGAYHPCERVYTLGRYRPGNCNPHYRYAIPITWQGILKEGLTATALVFAL